MFSIIYPVQILDELGCKLKCGLVDLPDPGKIPYGRLFD